MPTLVIAGTAVSLKENNRIVSSAMYAETSPRVIQLIELSVPPKHRRKGHASTLLKMLVKKLKPRKMWVAIGHKNQVIARSFLTRHGFHHISTTSNLLSDEDLLIYAKSWV